MTLHIGSMMPDRSLDESVLVKAITKVATDLAGLRDQLVQQKTILFDVSEHLALVELVIP